MDHTAFSHGQIHSKLWLCETIESHLPQGSSIAVLGSWYNILGFMLLTRNPNKYKSIIGIDKDDSAVTLANKFCDGFIVHENIVKNICLDANMFDYKNIDVVISCSVEHIESVEWYKNIPTGTIVCLQTVICNDEQLRKDWNIVNHFESLDAFVNHFNLSTMLYTGTKDFVYPNLQYTRLMLIGIK